MLPALIESSDSESSPAIIPGANEQKQGRVNCANIYVSWNGGLIPGHMYVGTDVISGLG